MSRTGLVTSVSGSEQGDNGKHISLMASSMTGWAWSGVRRYLHICRPCDRTLGFPHLSTLDSKDAPCWDLACLKLIPPLATHTYRAFTSSFHSDFLSLLLPDLVSPLAVQITTNLKVSFKLPSLTLPHLCVCAYMSTCVCLCVSDLPWSILPKT